MKKFICFILIFAFSFALFACDGDVEQPEATESSTVTDAPSETEEKNETNESVNDTEAIETVTDAPSETEGKNETNESVNDTEAIETVTDAPSETDTDQSASTDKVNYQELLQTLLGSYKWNPQSFIPEKLRPDYQGNLIDPSYIQNDYSNFVDVSNIPKNGIGEQWSMVTDNLTQSGIFFDVLSCVDTLSSISVSAYNNFISSNPVDASKFQFENGIFTVTINCDKDSIYYVVDYETEIDALGEQHVQIYLLMDIKTQFRTVRVQIGDQNSLKYTIEGDKYTFAIKYLGLRCAYLEIEKEADGSTIGHIYEYLTVSSIEFASFADFYITDKYMTVVGNKADSIIGSTGYTCELYSLEKGKMIAYEVMEDIEISSVNVVFDTLWFDLEDIEGINSIAFVPAKDNKDEDAFFINGSSKKWEPKYYGFSGGLKALSRKFDIEFKTQYFYCHDVENDTYEKIAVKVPMLFIQADALEHATDDIKDKNKVDVSIDISENDLALLQSEYASKIELAKQNKDLFSVEFILSYIGEKI